MSKDNQYEQVYLTGLWEKKDKNGNSYFTGDMGIASVRIFKNRHKEQENHPDYNMYVAAKPKRQEQEKEENSEIPF